MMASPATCSAENSHFCASAVPTANKFTLENEQVELLPRYLAARLPKFSSDGTRMVFLKRTHTLEKRGIHLGYGEITVLISCLILVLMFLASLYWTFYGKPQTTQEEEAELASKAEYKSKRISPQQVTVNEINESDTPKLLTIFNHYAVNTFATFLSSELSLAAFRGQVMFPIESKYRSYCMHLTLPESVSVPVGYFTLCQLQKRSEYDNSVDIILYIDKDYLHRGIGRIIFPQIEMIAKEKGFDSVLATIISENHAAISFFESIGYEQVAKIRKVGRKFDQILDQVTLQKLIESSDVLEK